MVSTLTLLMKKTGRYKTTTYSTTYFSAEAYNNFGLNTVGFRMAEEYTTVDLDQKIFQKKL